MSNVPNSFNHDYIAHYLSETDAQKDATKAAQKDPGKKYKVKYSWKQGVWVVAMISQEGGLLGYLHPILD
jgi:hypothetical protein